MKTAGKAHGCWSLMYEGGTQCGEGLPRRAELSGGMMQGIIASIFAQVAEMGVFFVAAAALVAGALSLR